MKVYSKLRKKRITSLVKSLSLENEDGVIADSSDYEEDGTKLFLSSSLEKVDGAIIYGENIRSLGEGLYSDACDPSRVFYYPDPDTAAIAYAIAKEYSIPLERLRDVKLENDTYYLVHDAREIRSIINHKGGHLKVYVIFSFDTYSDMHSLASAFQNADVVFLLSKGREEEKRFKKALDRVIFSPVVKRISAVVDIKSIDDIMDYITADDIVFEIELRGEEKA